MLSLILNQKKLWFEVIELNELKKRIRRLERALGQKTLDNDILREAVKIGREKNSSRDSRCQDKRI